MFRGRCPHPQETEFLDFQYEEFIKENNERIQRESQEVRKIAESITLDEGFYDNYSSLTTRKSSNGSNGRVFEGESQRNGERNTEEGSGNQRGLKGGRASLAVDSAGNTLKGYLCCHAVDKPRGGWVREDFGL